MCRFVCFSVILVDFFFIFLIGAVCYRSFCHAYWGCTKHECMGCIGKFKGKIKYYRVAFTLNSLILPCFCACPKPRPGFPMSYVMVFLFVFNGLRWETIVHFVNIGGIVDCHCLNFLFTILNCHLLPITQLYIRSIF